MAQTIAVTEDSFEETVLKNTLPVMVDFWAEWCPPCKMIGPIMEELADEYDGTAVVTKINVDKNPGLAQKYGVRSIPTILFFKGGEVKDQVVGALPKDQFKARLDKLA
jgi:thioredoxin 1